MKLRLVTKCTREREPDLVPVSIEERTEAQHGEPADVIFISVSHRIDEELKGFESFASDRIKIRISFNRGREIILSSHNCVLSAAQVRSLMSTDATAMDTVPLLGKQGVTLGGGRVWTSRSDAFALAESDERARMTRSARSRRDQGAMAYTLRAVPGPT
jgi:hypothetical protein